MMAGLLERLARMTRCAYLSDLRHLSKRELFGAIEKIEARDYSVTERTVAAQYLVGGERPFDYHDAVRAALLDCLT